MCKGGKLFRRYESTLWTIAEEEALAQIDPLPKELQLLKSYYSANFRKDEDYRRRNLLTLLNNWNSELDRARAWAKEALPRLNGFDIERKSRTLKQLEELRKKKRFLAQEFQTCKS